jgi:hypothetical protein
VYTVLTESLQHSRYNDSIALYNTKVFLTLLSLFVLVSSVSVGTMLPIETAEDEDDITWGLYKSTDEDYEDVRPTLPVHHYQKSSHRSVPFFVIYV